MGYYSKMTFQKVGTEEPVFTYEGELNTTIVPTQGEHIQFNYDWYEVDRISRHYRHDEHFTCNRERAPIKIETEVIVVCVWIKPLE